MKIGIDASRAFGNQRTGIEEYSYQVIKYLKEKLSGHQVALYIQKNQKINFDLPEGWKIKVINFPRLWTQLGLSLEILLHPVDMLFVPAHVVPLIHPRNTVVTIHGLEFEMFPEGYSFWARMYMRWSIKMSCRWAKTVIAVSENTKKDLVELYGVAEDKIKVVYEGISDNFEFRISNFETNSNFQNSNFEINSKFEIQNSKFLLFIGRLEKRKNIEGIIEAYKILKEKYNIPHDLVLAGSPGYGYDIIKSKIKNYLKNYLPAGRQVNSKFKIIEPGYIDEASKWQLLSNADVFLFPTFYEGFGLPILEAQSAGVPVVASNNSSIPEIVGAIHELPASAIFCDPQSPESIAEAVWHLISNTRLKNDIIKKGHENVLRFSWEKCAADIASLILHLDNKKEQV